MTTIRAAGAPSQTVYVNIFNSSNKVWNGSAFVTFNAPDIATYSLAATETVRAGYPLSIYSVTVPAGIVAAGDYDWFMYAQVGATPASGDIAFASDTFTLLAPPLATGLNQASLEAQLMAVQAAITTALGNPFGSWRVGNVQFDQTRYLEYLAQLQTDLVKLMRSEPSESIDTVQNAIGPMGHDATEYLGEEF